MRQAILITAYKNLNFLNRVISYFDTDFEIYIHIDKKSNENEDVIAKLPNVHVYRQYKIEWGGYNHVKAILLLIKEAFKYEDIAYFHLITGSDYPIRPLAEFKRFFEENKEENYLEYFPLPRESWAGNGGLDRINYYWIKPNMRPGRWTWLNEKSLKLQRKLHFVRKFPYFNGKLYGGGTYWSVSRTAISYLLRYFQTVPSYLNRFRFTSVAEEICFPSVWINSDLHFNNNSLRYMKWIGNNASPEVLTEKDYEEIIDSDCFWCRKVEVVKSEILLNELYDYQKGC